MKRLAQLSLLFVTACSLEAANNYLVHNLVSDLPGIADHQDKNLVNPWGNAFSSGSPFWVGNNGTGTSTLYDGTGTASALVVKIPGTGGTSGTGKVTGVISNGTTAFNVGGPSGKPAAFIFCGEDGIISGWNPAVDATNAKVMVDNSGSGAVYKGCAIGGTADAPMLFAANFSSGKIDVWDGSLKPGPNPNAFSNPTPPSGFAPFNIQNISNRLYVTYAKQSADKQDDVRGVGNGYVAVFDMAGNLTLSLISQGPLNSPWGLAIAPASFGDFANTLLVGNFGDGMIHAFDPVSGALKGTLNDQKGSAIAIPGLWSLNFGNGARAGDTATLYFTAGINGNGDPVESHGLLGSIQAAPFIRTGIGGGSFNTVIGPNMWVSIFGGGLSATTRAWTAADFKGNQLPTQLDGVGVFVNGEAAFVGFISPTQINFLTPADLPLGPVNIQTTNNGLTSANIPVAQPAQAAVPTLFNLPTAAADGHLFAAAEHADGTLGAPAGLIKGATSTPFHVGETIVLFGTAFGGTTPPPPNGVMFNTDFPLIANPSMTIGGKPATVTFAGLISPGLYQINVVIPAGIPLNDPGPFSEVPVVTMVAGATVQANGLIPVANPGQ